MTRRGVETAVLVPIDQWRRLRPPAKSNLKNILLAPEPRTENLVPPRAPLRMRPAPTFDQARVDAPSPRQRARVEGVLQAVAEEVERHHRGENR